VGGRPRRRPGRPADRAVALGVGWCPLARDGRRGARRARRRARRPGPVRQRDRDPAARFVPRRSVIRGAREHNLKNVNLELPRDKLIVFTGLSGSGKSSLAFDTIYAEGQRRYVESLSLLRPPVPRADGQARRRLHRGLSPAISIDQKSASRNPRSTVGTITEVYDYLRLLFARIGIPHCPTTAPVVTASDAAADRRPRPRAARGHPLPGARPGGAGPQGRVRHAARGPGRPGLRPGRRRRRAVRSTSSQRDERLARYEQHTIEVVVDRLVLREGIERRLTDSLETALGSPRASPRSRSSRPTRRRQRDAHVQPAPRVPRVRHELRRAGSPELLVQLALRGLRAPATASAPASRSIPSWSSRTRPPSPRAPSPRGAPPTPSTSAACSSRSPRPTASTSTSPWGMLTAKQQKVILHGSQGQGHGQVQEPLRPPAALRHRVRGRHPLPAAPPLRRRERHPARADRGLHARGALPPCGGARLKPATLAVKVDDKNIAEVCEMSIGESAKFLASLELSERDRLIAERVVKEINARSASCSTSGSTTSRCRARPARWPGARRSASASPARSAAGSWACSTCSTSRRSGSTSATTAAHRHAHPAARPRQHGHRRRARRGDHPRERLGRRHRSRSRRARRRRGLQRPVPASSR
jgi:excinuclease ABC subunit A